MDNKTKWIPISGFESRYSVSDKGEVLSSRTLPSGETHSIILRPRVHNGYARVALQLNGKRIDKSVHRLVANAFVSNQKALPQVNHIDGNKLNNIASNLEWCSASENIIHSYKLKLSKPKLGERHGRSKLTEPDVLAIRHIYANCNVSQSVIAELFKIKQVTVSDIVTFRIWKHI